MDRGCPSLCPHHPNPILNARGARLLPPRSWGFSPPLSPSHPTRAGQGCRILVPGEFSCLEMSSSALSQLIPPLKALNLPRTPQLGSGGAEQQQQHPLGALGTGPGWLWCSPLAASPAPVPGCALGGMAEVLGCLGSRNHPAGAQPSLPSPAGAPGPPSLPPIPGSCCPTQPHPQGSASCQDQALNQELNQALNQV